MAEINVISLIDALQTIVKSQGDTIRLLLYNEHINSRELECLKKRVTALEPYVYENNSDGDLT